MNGFLVQCYRIPGAALGALGLLPPDCGGCCWRIPEGVNLEKFSYLGQLTPNLVLLVTTKIVSFLWASLFSCALLYSQSVEIIDLQLTDAEEVVLTFQIAPDNSLKERYDVKVYGSHDGFANPLDLELSDLQPSTPIEVRFLGPEKIGAYSGELRFRIVAEASLFPVRILPSTSRAIKRSKPYTVSWDDYHRNGPYDIDLLQGSQVAHKIATGVTQTSYSYSLPKSMAKGAYSLRVTPVNNPAAQSEPFPMRLKGSSVGLLAGVGVAAGGALAYFVLLQGGGDTEPPIVDEDDLPDPPGTPN